MPIAFLHNLSDKERSKVCSFGRSWACRRCVLFGGRALLATIDERQVYDMWRGRDLEYVGLEVHAYKAEVFESPVDEKRAIVEPSIAINKALSEALSGLSDKARTAFIYSQLDGLTCTEIALRLGVSPNMVRQYISKALHKLADLLRQGCGA